MAIFLSSTSSHYISADDVVQCLAERYTDVYVGSQANNEVGLSVMRLSEVIIVGLLLI